MSAAIGLLLLGSSIVLRVEAFRGVEQDDAADLAVALGRSIRARTSSATAIDDLSWGGCAESDRCLATIRARTGAGEVVLLRIFGASTRILLVAERFGSNRTIEAKADLPKDRAGWLPPLEAAAATLYPEAIPSPAIVIAPGPPAMQGSSSIVPWLVLGGGAVALGAGIAFGASSHAALGELESRIVFGPDDQSLASRGRTQAIAANVLFGVAAAALIGGAAGFLF